MNKRGLNLKGEDRMTNLIFFLSVILVIFGIWRFALLGITISSVLKNVIKKIKRLSSETKIKI